MSPVCNAQSGMGVLSCVRTLSVGTLSLRKITAARQWVLLPPEMIANDVSEDVKISTVRISESPCCSAVNVAEKVNCGTAVGVEGAMRN